MSASPTPPPAAETDAPAPPAGPPSRRAASRSTSGSPAKSASKSASKSRKRAPAQPRPGTVPGRSYDMRPLCEAARGTVAPEIVALCG
ncbi:hypothetical protein ACWEPM_06685 [Streptomyces sp. NPDC004244]|uniref:hypothetical protein n=1 Tax=Streptomyces sp. NPDC101206 TaxID=3366128 RepID=UPI00380BD609